MRKKYGRHPAQIFINMGLLGLIVFGLWAVFLFQFAEAIPRQVENPEAKSDAIVVLTGGSGRLSAGLELLTQGKSDKLFVSGVYQGLDIRDLLATIKGDSSNNIVERISIGNATNTAENADETMRWAKKNNINSLRLVTAAYHMPRSLLEFENAMPGVKIIQNPVFPAHVKHARWWAWPGTASLMASEFTKYILVWVRHQLQFIRYFVLETTSMLLDGFLSVFTKDPQPEAGESEKDTARVSPDISPTTAGESE